MEDREATDRRSKKGDKRRKRRTESLAMDGEGREGRRVCNRGKVLKRKEIERDEGRENERKKGRGTL